MPLASKWIPPQDHSVFISCLASTAIGAALAYHLHGVLIDAYGWASVFYVTGSMGLLWSLVWFYLVYDSPNQHPRISQREKQTIESEIEVNNAKPKQFNQIPWKQIAKSGPVWAITAGQVATFLGYTTCLNEMPSYLDQVLHLNIKQNGFFSGLPYWGGYCASLGSGYIADWLIKSGKLSTTTVRKIFESVALLIPTMSMLTLALWGDIPLIAFIAFTTSLTTNAISTAGHAANILDISPNYAGTICGIVNTFSAFAVYLSTRLVAMLLRNGQSFQEWRHLFWTLFSTYLSASIIYLIWCSSKVQPWDSEKREENVPHSIDMHLLGKKENA
ncbi:hypothetical protein MTP99_012508 [Tenebrio molitor]|nr:hypothetical protein MTP99_012508 [Tenebrio molitor]